MIKKILKDKKGDGILSFIVVLSITALLAVTILPPLQKALGNRMESTVESFNGADTIVIE